MIMIHMLWYPPVIIGFVLSLKGCMAVGKTSAVCVTDKWTFNQKGMSPCLVAANLEAVCSAGGDWNVPGLSHGSNYLIGPTSPQVNGCTCSTVVYSLVAACSICQQGKYITWRDWRKDCNEHDVSVSSYPFPIPSGVTIPAWAYLNVTANNTFDPNAALSVYNAGVPDVGSENHGSMGPLIPAVSNSSTTHLDAIIGGTVLIIIIACVSYYIRRKRRSDYSPQEHLYQQQEPYYLPFLGTYLAQSSAYERLPISIGPATPAESVLFDSLSTTPSEI